MATRLQTTAKAAAALLAAGSVALTLVLSEGSSGAKVPVPRPELSACAKKKNAPYCVKVECDKGKISANRYSVKELIAAKHSLAADEIQYSQYARCDIEIQRAIYENLRR